MNGGIMHMHRRGRLAQWPACEQLHGSNVTVTLSAGRINRQPGCLVSVAGITSPRCRCTGRIAAGGVTGRRSASRAGTQGHGDAAAF